MIKIVFIFLLINYIYCFENYNNIKLLFSDKIQGAQYSLKELSNIPFQIKFPYKSDEPKLSDIELSWSFGENSYCANKNPQSINLTNSVCYVNLKSYTSMLISKPNELVLERLIGGNGLTARYTNDITLPFCNKLENHDIVIQLKCDRSNEMSAVGCKLLNQDVRCPGIVCLYKSKHTCPKLEYSTIESISFIENGILYTNKTIGITNYMPLNNLLHKQFNVTIDFHLKDYSVGIHGFKTIANGLYSYSIDTWDDISKNIQFTMVGNDTPTLFFDYD